MMPRSCGPTLQVEAPPECADLLDFSERAAITVLNYFCVLIVEADKATRSLGEQRMKEMITEGIGAVRQALEQVSRHLPEDEFTQREFAQRFLEATREGASPGHAHQRPDARDQRRRSLVCDVLSAPEDRDRCTVERQVSPQEMRRVGEEFGALRLPYTEQDIVSALGWVRAMISDVQNVLLEFDDSDLEELAQMTLISLRILVRYAKNTHRSLAQLCGMPEHHRPHPSLVTVMTATPSDGIHDGISPEQTPPVRDKPALLQVDRDDDDDDDDDEGGDYGRVLPWDPLAPRLLQEAQRLAEQGQKKPFTAAVVLAAALPFSGCAVAVGAPVLAGDAALQWGAGTPLGRTVCRGAKNAVELSKLGWVASKLATKQTLKLASQELDRVGGVTGLAWRAGEGALWTARHPVEAAMTTVGMAADTGKAMYDQALWVGDLLASVGEEVFAGPADTDDE